MFSSFRPLLCFRMLCLLLIGCAFFSFAGRSLQADSAAGDGRSDSSSPIIFDGWRRTTNGWEQLPFTEDRLSINDWIAHQEEEEAGNPLTLPLQKLSQIHPVRIAAAEVALACLIALLANSDGSTAKRRGPRFTARLYNAANGAGRKLGVPVR